MPAHGMQSMKFLVLGATGIVGSRLVRGLMEGHHRVRALPRDARKAQALGRPIAYAGHDPDAWEARALEFLPPWLAYDLRRMYARFVAHGLIGTESEIRTLTRLLGHPPGSFEAFADEAARAWSAHDTAVVKS